MIFASGYVAFSFENILFPWSASSASLFLSLVFLFCFPGFFLTYACFYQVQYITDKDSLFFFLIVVAVNYIAISEALGISPSVLAAGVAADNVICALYFFIIVCFGL